MDHRVIVFVKTRKRLWNDDDELFYKYFEDSFEISCPETDLDILLELNSHKEEDGVINILKIPDLIDAHMGHSLILEWDDDDVVYIQTTDKGIEDYELS